jgi:hypothetical protein
MTIRTFQTGDDVAQVSIYNEAAADLPRFKPATLDEVRRRLRGSDFDPASRFFALAGGKPVGYATFSASGRVSFPWCRKGHEGFAAPLVQAVLDEMRRRGMTSAFAAYRADWPGVRAFFEAHGFALSREMVNFVLDIVDMPTPSARYSSSITPLTPADLPAVARLGTGVLRDRDLPALEEHLFRNSYFPPSSLFALRSKIDDKPVAVGLLVESPAFAHPAQVDPGMPCFRLGAFGTEGLTHKRINGVFSVLAADTHDLPALALDLLGYATHRLQETEVETLAAQVSSDVPHLMRFYKSLFRRQGSFPLFERRL